MGFANEMTTEPTDWQGSALPARAMTQAECDAIQAEARSNKERPSILREVKKPPPLEPTEILLESRLAQEIEYAQRLLEAVGDRFISDPIILNRHQSALQNFDILSQLLGHLAKVIGSKDKDEAVERIGMQELRSRLQRPNVAVTQAGTIGALERSLSNPFRTE